MINGQDRVASLIANSALGGAASVAGGGKFANGAITGAFGYMFNAAGGRKIGSAIGSVLAGTLGSESGPLDIAIAVAGHYAGGAIGSAIEDSLFGSQVRFVATDQGIVDVGTTLDRIDSDGTNPHRNDGTTFQNREDLLPKRSEGYYTEYVVPTPGIYGPGPMRVVTGQSGEAYFSPDHYKTFIPVRIP